MLIRVPLALVLLTGLSAAQEPVNLTTEDGGLIHAIVYGKGDRGVVLAHGGRFQNVRGAIAAVSGGFT